MNNPLCAVCGHINRVGAVVCEMCDCRLTEPAGQPAGATEDFRRPGEEPRPGGLPTLIPSPFFKTAGDVIRPTVEVYRKNFLLVGLLVLVTTLPAALLQYAGARALLEANDPLAGGNGLFSVGLLSQGLTWVLSVAGSALLGGALVYAVLEWQRTGQAAPAGESLRRGLKTLPKVFLVSLLYGIVVMVGYVLLIVPGVIFSLMYAVVIPVAVAENRGVGESFSRSAELTRGYKGLIFITYFLWGLLMMVLGWMVAGSFAIRGFEDGLASMVTLALISALLESTTTVLTVYIFLGLLNEARHGFGTGGYAPPAAPAAAAR